MLARVDKFVRSDPQLQGVVNEGGIGTRAGTDVAVEAGDVVFVRSDPRDVDHVTSSFKLHR